MSEIWLLTALLPREYNENKLLLEPLGELLDEDSN